MADAHVHGIAGALGGISALLTTYPLSLVTVRKAARTKASTISSDPEERQRNGSASIIKILKEEGIYGLYKGIGTAVVGTAASQGVYYYFYQLLGSAWLKKNGNGAQAQLGPIESLLVASLSGAMNVFITNPIWVLVTRIQVQKQKTTFVESAKDLYKAEGLNGFYRGLIPSLVMVCNPAISFMFYEVLVSVGVRKTNRGKPIVSPLQAFIFGALAKLGATLITYPLLLVKQRLHTDSGKYLGPWHAIGKIRRQEGILGFYKGLHTKIFQSVLAAAVLFMTKEELVHQTKAFLKSAKITKSS